MFIFMILQYMEHIKRKKVNKRHHYIPDIDEFYIGFKFLRKEGNKWISHDNFIELYRDIKSLKKDIDMEIIKVEHFDVDDLIHYNFDTEYDYNYDTVIYTNDKFTIIVPDDINMLGGFTYLRIYEVNNMRKKYFDGVIRNKCELVKLLKML